MEQVTVDKLDETLARTRRIETRLMKLCSAMGVDATSGKVRILVTEEPQTVEVAALDVSIGDCLLFCKKSGIFGDITLTHKGETIGTVKVAA